METVQDYLRTEVPRFNGKALKKAIPVGIEVELENVQLTVRPTGWTIVNDGSLKIAGKEFTIPVWNTSAYVYLTNLFGSLKAETSARCSVHVHVDISKLSIIQLQNLLLIYCIFENTLYRYSGRRWGSNYCVPVRSHLHENICGLRMENLFNIFPKYSGLHFFPDNKLCTVEFRQMAGTMNKDYINNWIMIVSNLVKYAQNVDQEALLERINTMYTTSSYWDFAKEVFEDYYNVLTNEHFKKDVESGVLFVKVFA